MKRRVFYLLLVFCVTGVKSQDSLSVKHTHRHLYYREVITDFNAEPFLFYITPFQNYTRTGFSFSQENNNVRSEQTPKSNLYIRLRGYGVHRYKKALFVGYLGCAKNYKKGLGFNLTNMFPHKNKAERSPFYALAYGEGSWNNQYYNLKGDVAFPVLRDKIFMVVGANYNALHFFRTVEPKPELKNLEFVRRLSWYFRVRKSYLGIHFKDGIFDSLTDITFDAPSYLVNIPANKNVYVRTSYGYGVIETAKHIYNKEKEHKRGAGISYITRKDKKLLISNISYLSTKNLFYTSYKLKDIPLGNYTVGRISIRLNHYDFAKGRRLSFRGIYTFGKNYRNSTDGTNYESGSLDVEAAYQILNRENNIINSNYGTVITLCKLSKKDYQAVNDFSFINTGITLFYGKDFSVSDINKIYLICHAGIALNLEKQAYFSQDNEFITSVAIPDYKVNTAQKLIFQVDTGYQKTYKNNTQLNFGMCFSPRVYLNIDPTIVKNTFNYTAQLYFCFVY